MAAVRGPTAQPRRRDRRDSLAVLIVTITPPTF
jgi:hypothetical protein